MIIVKLIGGLGNQMFQYALGRSLSLKNNTELKLDITGFESYKLHKYSLDAFNIKKNVALKSEISRFKKYKPKPGRRWFLYNKFFADNSKYFQENGFNFNLDTMKLNDNVYLDGHWQSEKYFQEIENIISREFTLKNKPTAETENWIEKVSDCISVSVHIRRGDYARNQKTNQFHGTCSLEYYEKAMDLIFQKTKEPIFFIFSDDIDWAKNNLKTKYPIFHVSDKKILNYEELVIASKCSHNIIANSTFSWWSARLNENPDKIIIAPQKWFADASKNDSDLIPPTWTKL